METYHGEGGFIFPRFKASLVILVSLSLLVLGFEELMFKVIKMW